MFVTRQCDSASSTKCRFVRNGLPSHVHDDQGASAIKVGRQLRGRGASGPVIRVRPLDVRPCIVMGKRATIYDYDSASIKIDFYSSQQQAGPSSAMCASPV